MSDTINLDDSNDLIDLANVNNNLEIIVINSPAIIRTNSNALQAIDNTPIRDAQVNRNRFHNEEQDNDDDFLQSRSKIPRLADDSDVKTTCNKENSEKVEEEEVRNL